MNYDLNDLRYFVLVAQHGGYASASRVAGVPRATLSRRVAALEDALGARLIERSSRSFRLTEPGRLLYQRAQPVITNADEAASLIESGMSQASGVVKFSLPPTLLSLRFDEMVLDFMDANPAVTVEMDVTNRQVDLSREDVDFVLRMEPLESAPLDQIVLPLGHLENVLVAHPDVASATIKLLGEALRQAPALCWAGPSQPAYWRMQDADGKSRRIAVKPRLAVEDLPMLRKAALQQMGMAILPHFLVFEDIAADRLIELDLDLKPAANLIHAAHLGSKGMRPAVRHLLDGLKLGYQDLCTLQSREPAGRAMKRMLPEN